MSESKKSPLFQMKSPLIFRSLDQKQVTLEIEQPDKIRSNVVLNLDRGVLPADFDVNNFTPVIGSIVITVDTMKKPTCKDCGNFLVDGKCPNKDCPGKRK